MGRRSKIRATHLAEAAGVSRSAVSQNRHVQKNADGTVDVDATKRNLIETECALLRQTIATANLRELEFRKRAAKLVDAKEAAAAWRRLCEIVRGQLLAVPGDVSEELAGLNDAQTIRKLLDERFRAALGKLQSEIVAFACGG